VKTKTPPKSRIPAEPTPVLLSLAEAAKRLAVCTKTLRRSISRGRIHAVKLRIGVGQGLWRVPLTEIERVINEGLNPWR